jgi:CHAD domain-containing protein
MELDYVKLKEIKPALAGYIREAQGLLIPGTIPDEKVVHDVRVWMKKSRAVLKLIANQVDKESFDKDYDAFRETGRILRLWRETTVHRKTIKELKKSHSKIFSMLGENEKLETLMKKSELPADPSPAISNDVEKIVDILNKAGFRVRFQRMSNFDPRILIKELDNTYNKVVVKYLIGRNTPKPGNLHLLRKNAKDFLYQLYFFRPLNPAVVKALEKKLDSMTQNLGKYNDLVQLIQSLGYKYSDTGNSAAMDELMVIIREEQDKYLSKVWPVAYKIFCPGQKLVNILGFKILMI